MEVQAEEDVVEQFDSAEEAVEEYVELPEIYENTIIYNGTTIPGVDLHLTLSGDEMADIDSPTINEAGQFSLSLAMEEFEAGDELQFLLIVPSDSPEGHEEVYISVEVLPAEEGQEIVESSADTSDVEETVRNETEIDWLIENATPAFELRTVGDADSLPIYSIANEPITEDALLEHYGDNLYRANLPEEAINAGDPVTVYVVASGVTTEIETTVPEDLAALPSQEEATDSEEDFDEDIEDDTDIEDEEIDNETEEDDQEDEEEPEQDIDLDTESETEEQGVSWVWIVLGIVVILAIVGGIIYAMKKKKQV